MTSRLLKKRATTKFQTPLPSADKIASPSLDDTTKAPNQTVTSSVDQNRSISFFTRLPPEIRQEIWLQTFIPRIVQLTIHQGRVQPEGLERACVVFTATLGRAETDPAIPASITDWEYTTLTRGMARRPPPGPATLHINRESRAIALQHYSLAFGGLNLRPADDDEFSAEWEEKGYGQKKIWVDFERDLIVVEEHGMTQHRVNSDPQHPLHLLTRFAPEEVKKIRRLGVSERWQATSPIPDRAAAIAVRWFHSESAGHCLLKTLKHFVKLKELEVYEIGELWLKQRYWRDLYQTMQTLETNFLLENMDAWKAQLVEVLEKERDEDEEWKHEMPRITVRKGLCEGKDRWDGELVPVGKMVVLDEEAKPRIGEATSRNPQ